MSEPSLVTATKPRRPPFAPRFNPDGTERLTAAIGLVLVVLTVAELGTLLLGGYFGGWVAAGEAWGLPLDAAALRAGGHSIGCGVVAVLPEQRCGVVETARIMSHLSAESARQCGPCVFGLRAIAAAVDRIATGTAEPDDLERIRRWSGEIRGRGACRHPDGAAGFLLSALRVFGDDVAHHHRPGVCAGLVQEAA